MKSSGNSSATGTPRSPDRPARRQFALTGRSAVLDPRTHAVRSDVADVRLAERVFAPHYAAPMARAMLMAAVLREGAAPDAAVLARMTEGDPFEVLEISGTQAWGIATRAGLVGYVDAAAVAGLAA